MKAKWVAITEEELIKMGMTQIWECSQCKDTTDVKFKFCPNCGADMRGEE